MKNAVRVWARPVPLVALVLLSEHALAQTVIVPGDHPDPQSAVNGVAPGTTILVQGGSWPPLTIDKELTIIGDGATAHFSPQGHVAPGIRLVGPGTGRVVLVNVSTSAVVSGSTYFRGGDGIAGGGFDELHVLDSSIAAGELCCLSGLGYGDSGIDTSVQLVWIERSTVSGSRTDIDGTLGNRAPDAEPGVRAPGQVVALESVLEGGDNGVYGWYSGGNGECPPPCPAGGGGNAVECDTLFTADSSLVHGMGATWVDDLTFSFCCQVPSPTLPNANTHLTLPSSFDPVASPSIGGPFHLSWSTPGPTAWLLTSTTIEAGTLYRFGVWFLGPFGNVASRPVHSPGSYGATVPNDPTLIGARVGFQLYDRTIGLSRPVTVVALH